MLWFYLSVQLLLPAHSGQVDQVHISGRRHGSSFDWTGVVVTASFSSSSCAVTLTESSENRYGIYLDGTWYGTIHSKQGKRTYPVYVQLSARPRNFTMVKLTEACGPATRCTWADFGMATFEALVLDEGAAVFQPFLPWLPRRRLEFIGDSITCAWGVQGGSDDASCSDSENASASWASLLSDRLGAERHVIAWSGIGLIQNDRADTLPPKTAMPALWERTLASSLLPKWNFKTFLPSAVLVHLGTNDFTPGFNMSLRNFRNAYVDFLHRIDESYAGVPILLACGPMGTTGDPRGAYLPCSAISELTSAMMKQGLDVHFLNFSGLYTNRANLGGCGHPSPQGHRKMAEIAEPIVRRVLTWESDDAGLDSPELAELTVV